MCDGEILIVDDSHDNLKLTQILLELEGYRVCTAKDAGEALRILQTCLPRLILMDVQLPGVDGLELTRRLRRQSRLRDVTIVALTAYAMKGDQENAQAAGCDGYITKPIDTRTFPGVVRGFLGKGRAAFGPTETPGNSWPPHPAARETMWNADKKRDA